MRIAHRRTSGLAAVLVALAIGGCRTGGREETGAASGSNTADTDNVASQPFHGNAEQARAGRVTFVEYNCYGCHGGLAGGAMGPSLRDTIWKYGGTDAQIYASIHDGRPMGMPTWGPTLSDAQIRNLVAYIRSLRTDAEPKVFFIDMAATQADTTRRTPR
jgi:mono/diheme cytochrome c family protein